MTREWMCAPTSTTLGLTHATDDTTHGMRPSTHSRFAARSTQEWSGSVNWRGWSSGVVGARILTGTLTGITIVSNAAITTATVIGAATASAIGGSTPPVDISGLSMVLRREQPLIAVTPRRWLHPIYGQRHPFRSAILQLGHEPLRLRDPLDLD